MDNRFWSLSEEGHLQIREGFVFSQKIRNEFFNHRDEVLSAEVEEGTVSLPDVCMEYFSSMEGQPAFNSSLDREERFRILFIP